MGSGQSRELWQVQLGGTSSLRSICELEAAFLRGDIDERTPVRKSDDARWTTFGEATGRTRSDPSAPSDEAARATSALRPPPLSGGPLSLTLTREELDAARPRTLFPLVLLAACAALVGGGALANRYVPEAKSFVVARGPSLTPQAVRAEVASSTAQAPALPSAEMPSAAPPVDAHPLPSASSAPSPAPPRAHASAPT